jgi:hypothetical protein
MNVQIGALLLALLWGFTSAQTDSTPKKRLYSPAKVSGFIGGESHDSYVIHVRQGQSLMVQLAWKPEGKNQASFMLSRTANFFAAEPVRFGCFSSSDTHWTGKVPHTGEYFIFVVAHPTAQYTLQVKIK